MWPTGEQILTSLAISTAVIGVVRQYFKIEGLLKRTDSLEQSLEQEIKNLDDKFLRKDLAAQEFFAMREIVNRVEKNVLEIKNDLKESMHSLRNDLLVIFAGRKND